METWGQRVGGSIRVFTRIKLRESCLDTKYMDSFGTMVRKFMKITVKSKAICLPLHDG